MQIEEAIKLLEEFKKNGYSILYVKYGDRNKTNFKIEKAIETVLNYIETMHKEFDRLEGIEDNTEMLKQELIETKEHNRQLALELEKKDKVIDEMAERINNHDIDEDVCKQMGKEFDCTLFNQDKNFCIDCIKEYFYKKVSEVDDAVGR